RSVATRVVASRGAFAVPRDRGHVERAAMTRAKRVRIVVVTLAGITVLAAGAVEGARRHRAGAAAAAAAVRAPDTVRVRVQVLNATKTRGLARRATMLLRDRGFD